MLNQVSVIGTVMSDPELKQTSTGKTMLKFSLAVTSRTGGKTPTDQVAYIDVTVWEEEAQFAKNVRRGQEVFVSGKLKTEKWPDKVSGKEMSKLVLQPLQIIHSYKLEDQPLEQGMEDSLEEMFPQPAPKVQARPMMRQNPF